MTVNTGYYLQTGHFGILSTLVSIPIGISIFLVILINEFPDYFSDRQSGKNTLVVRLGREKASRLYAGLCAACFPAMLFSVHQGGSRSAVFFSVFPLAIILRNLLSVKKREFLYAQALERLCARTLLLNLGITLLSLFSFIYRP